MRILVLLAMLLMPVLAQAAEICMELPVDKVSGAQDCKNNYQTRTGQSLTNSQLLSIAAMEFCRKEKRLYESQTLTSEVTAAMDAMEAGWCECGDNSLCYAEECDDGNTVGGDGCEANCTFPTTTTTTSSTTTTTLP